MTRYLLYGVVGIAAALAIAFAMALQYGLNPFDSRLALYWAVILMVAVYITLRVSMILENRRKRRAREDNHARPSGATRASAAKARSKDSLEARMAARRERVARAKAKEQGEGEA